MTYGEFTTKIGVLASYIEKEKRLCEEGIDLCEVTADLIDHYVDLLTMNYPRCREEIATFLWELDFGQRWKPGFFEDAFGRDVRLNSVHALWNYCECSIDKHFTQDDPHMADAPVIEAGRYHSIEYYICWNNMNWTAYIDLSGTRFVGIKSLPCHGGITWAKKFYPFEGGDSFPKYRWIVGWDYAHGGDVNSALSLEIIRSEIHEVISYCEHLPY